MTDMAKAWQLAPLGSQCHSDLKLGAGGYMEMPTAKRR